MAYVALRPMTVRGEEGQSVLLAPGQDVPGFADLKASVRQALLRSMYVQDTEDARLTPTPADGKLRMMPATWAPTIEKTFTDTSSKLLPCPHCEHPGFATVSGRSKHVARNHMS